MGHKGVSKRKPKKIKTGSGEKPTGPVNTGQEELSPVQSLINKKKTPLGNNDTPAKLKDKSKKGK